MPVIVDPVALLSYAAFPPELDRDWLGRVCHLSAADLEVVRRRTDKTTRLGYAIQLVTVRAIGTFLPDPTAVATGDFTAQPGHFLLLVWLYRQAWSDELSPSVLFGAAHRRLLAEQILLPGRSVLARLVARVRERAARRLLDSGSARRASTTNRGLLPGAPVPNGTGLPPGGLDKLPGRNVRPHCNARLALSDPTSEPI